MRLAVFGSRNIIISDIEDYIPEAVSEIVSGGARGIDTCAAEYARLHGIKLVEIYPEYDLYGRIAPLKRNEKIVSYADEGIAFWDGSSRGTKHTIDLFLKSGKRITVIIISK